MYIDISYPYTKDMAIYPNNPEFKLSKVLDLNKLDNANVTQITIGSHCGTHIDAPSHVIKGGKTLDQFSLEQMNGRTIVLDMTCRDDITEEGLQQYNIKAGDIVIFKTDNTMKFRGKYVLSEYTTLDYKAAEYLVNCKIKMVGIDYMTIERPRSKREKNKSVHQALLGNDILIAEALNMYHLNEGVYEMFCFPINIIGIDGTPVRIVLKQ